MSRPASRRLDYRTPPQRRPRRWFAATVAGLFLLQFPWACGWGIRTQGWLPDGSPKEPLRDFGIEVGIAIPTVGILAASAAQLVLHRHRRAPLRNAIPAIVVASLAALFVSAAILGWVWDDFVRRTVPYGGP